MKFFILALCATVLSVESFAQHRRAEERREDRHVVRHDVPPEHRDGTVINGQRTVRGPRRLHRNGLARRHARLARTSSNGFNYRCDLYSNTLVHDQQVVTVNRWSGPVTVHNPRPLYNFSTSFTCQKAEAISEKLRLPLPFTVKILHFLEDKGLVIKGKNERYSIGKTRMHLKSDSPLVKAHHQNYRHKAILSLEDENDFNLHYSGVLTLSKKDALKIRNLVLKLIADKEEILIPSPNEEMICFNLDLFKV